MADVLDIDELSVSEQRELFDRLSYKFALKMTGKPVEKAVGTADELIFWDELQAAVSRQSGVKLKHWPLAIYLKTNSYETFKHQHEIIEAVVRDGCPALTRKPVRLAVMGLVLDCLANYLSYGNVPVYHSRMLSNASKAATAVDQNYPGYINAKMLPRIISLSAQN